MYEGFCMKQLHPDQTFKGDWFRGRVFWVHAARCELYVPVLKSWIDWLIVLGLAVLWDSISVYIGRSPREREKEERKDRGE